MEQIIEEKSTQTIDQHVPEDAGFHFLFDQISQECEIESKKGNPDENE